MQQQPTFPSHAALRAPIPPGNGFINESLYWYPNELAVTVHAAKPPTLPQLRDLSARLNRLLSRVGASLIPFYSGGHMLSRGGPRASVKPKDSQASAQADKPEGPKMVDWIEVGSTPTTFQVEFDVYEQWQTHLQRCQAKDRFPGVHPFGAGQKGVAVVFYALRTHHRHPRDQRDIVQIAVDLINQHLALLSLPSKRAKFADQKQTPRPLDDQLKDINPHNPRDPAHQQPLRVLAAMPNWLTAPLQMGAQPPSGPGAPPLEATTLLQGRWEFKKSPFKRLLGRTKKSEKKVTVIILDTFFGGGQAEVEARAATLPQGGGNVLLQTIRADLNSGDMTIDTTMQPISNNFRAGLDEYGRPYGYDMVDHGLFVAGIIRGIVPAEQAKIELIRTQNDYGSGEMDLFLGALYDVSKHDHLDHVVLNLSLGILPPLEELQEIWFGPDCCCEGSDVASMLQTMELLHLGVRLPIEHLVEKDVVIVAAAGNDSLGKQPALGPRIPARYDDVLGVAAVDRAWQAAGYSNRANTLSWGRGIATYGGEQPNDQTETLAWLARKEILPSDEPDAVHGLYLYETFPPLSADDPNSPPTPNKYGCAWWSGTSFATPIASGLAAHYILDGKRGQGVINAILTDLVRARAPYEPRLQSPVLEVEEK